MLCIFGTSEKYGGIIEPNEYFRQSIFNCNTRSRSTIFLQNIVFFGHSMVNLNMLVECIDSPGVGLSTKEPALL